MLTQSNRKQYFYKRLLVIIPIAVFMIVKELYIIGFVDLSIILVTLIRGSIVGVVTGVIIGSS